LEKTETRPISSQQRLDLPRVSAGSPWASLERDLLTGVVPVSADVGTDCLAGDFGFDPLRLASKDWFRQAQAILLKLVPHNENDSNSGSSNAKTTAPSPPRLKALILRDYREAEIRHARLAMLAAVIWPLQEMVDQFVLPKDLAGPLVYGPVTLPFFPLAMTLLLLLLGYLDIFSQSIKDMDQLGEAFLPGDCFWDPLRMLPLAAPPSMKRSMQERELLNGRAAMLAVLAYTWEEVGTGKAIIDIPANALLFHPVYQIPQVQEWLDATFGAV
jgi:hypothetical protein